MENRRQMEEEEEARDNLGKRKGEKGEREVKEEKGNSDKHRQCFPAARVPRPNTSCRLWQLELTSNQSPSATSSGIKKLAVPLTCLEIFLVFLGEAGQHLDRGQKTQMRG